MVAASIPRELYLDQARSKGYRYSKERRALYANQGHLSVQQGGAAIGLHGPLVAFLSEQQNAAAISGAVGEIGVHHGRFWIAIAHTAREGEETFVCDLFEDQHLNKDGSGNGDRTKFFANANKFGIPTSSVSVYQMLSTNLPFNFTGDTAFRLLSIDGGHLAATAFSDLVWAAHSLVKGGIIMVDDFWHSDWIGVTEACYSYMNCASTAGYPELFPFFWGGSKLYFTNSKDHYELYYSAMLNDGMWGKTVESKMKSWTPRSCDKCAGKGAQKQHPNITLGPHNTAILRSLLAAKGNSATESAWIRLVGEA